MSEQINNTPLEQARLSYQQIQKFAEEQAAEQLKEQVAEKLKHLFEDKINEDITININGEDVEVSKDGESVAAISDTPEMGSEEMGLGDAETTMGDVDDSEEFLVSDE